MCEVHIDDFEGALNIHIVISYGGGDLGIHNNQIYRMFSS